MFIYFSPHWDQHETASDISAAILAISDRYSDLDSSKSLGPQSPLVKYLELSIKVSILAEALGIRSVITPREHSDHEVRNNRTLNDDPKGLTLFGLINEFVDSESKDFPASYFLALNNSDSKLWWSAIQYVAGTLQISIQEQGRYNAAPVNIGTGPGLIWWEKDPLRSDGTDKTGKAESPEHSVKLGTTHGDKQLVELQKPKNPRRLSLEISRIIKKHLQHEDNDPVLVPELFDAWWRFNFPGFMTEKSLNQLRTEANPGLHPTTKRGEVYWFKRDHKLQQELIGAGLLGVQFKLMESADDSSGDNDLIEVTFLMMGNKSFSFLLSRNLDISNLPEFFSDKQDEILHLVIFILSKIRNRQRQDKLDGEPTYDTQSDSEPGSLVDDYEPSTHLRVLVGKAPNRAWLDENSDLNLRVKRKYGITLMELNLHFTMVQILGEDYFNSLPEDGVKHLLEIYIQRKLLMVRRIIGLGNLSEVAAHSALNLVANLQISKNATETHQILEQLLGLETPGIPRDLALLTFVETQDNSDLPPREIDEPNIFDET